MLIGRAAQERYRSALGRVQKDAERYVARRLASEARGLPVAEAREAAVGILGDAVGVFGDTAQALSARLFDEICEAEGIDAASRMFDGGIGQVLRVPHRGRRARLGLLRGRDV